MCSALPQSRGDKHNGAIMASLTDFQDQVADRARRAAQMKRILVDPFRDGDGFIIPKNPAEAKQRDKILESAISDSAYSLSEHGGMIAAVHSRALQGYERLHGHLPPDDLLASCHKAIENALLLGSGKAAVGGIFESADMSTTEGVLMRDRLISLVLPVHLQSITANMVTFIPGEFNQSEFFRVDRVAGSTFGSLKKGDRIEYNYDGLYSVMDQRTVLGTGDGSTTDFTFDSKSLNGVSYPFKPKRTRIWVNRKMVAEDDGSGNIIGTYMQDGNPVVVSGAVDYADGKVTAKFTVAPTAGVELHIGFDVNIESNPELIPRVDHQMRSRVLYPHESAIAGNATIQAIWALRRELGQDIDNLTMQGLRNLLAADKDRKNLHDMLFHTRNQVEWNPVGDPALTLKEHYESLNAALLEVDTLLINGNGVAGLAGIVGGTDVVNTFRYLPAPYFVAAPGYRSVAQPHYVGTVFGQWGLYCNPQMDARTALCFGRGPDHGQTAFVVGDAVPALTFRHPVLGDLVQKATMWDLAYRDMQPFDGSDYLCKLVFTEE